MLMKQLREDIEGTKRAKEFQKLLQMKADDAELPGVGMDDILRPSLIGVLEKLTVRTKGWRAAGMENLGL
jgi:hypothetical protein